MRQMVMVGFLQAQNCTTLASAWRHPEARTDFTTAAYYQKIGQVLEAGKFQLAFFDDRLAMPDIYGGNPAEVVANGVRVVKLDPVATLLAMGFGTKYLGIGATASTTYYEPFDVARRFQTVDHMIGGRAAWNVVTSVNDGVAHNMGRDVHMGHDARYDRADEFREIVLRSWDAWDDDALVVDKNSGLFAHPDKVRRLEFEGKYMKSSGTFTVPRSPQGHPVVIQAGSSPRGKVFSARWAETVFVAYPDLEDGKKQYAEFKAAIAAHNRDPDKVTVNTIAYPVVAETRMEAEDKMALIDKLYKEVDGLSLLSEALNYDFKQKGLDEAFSDEELEGMSGMQAMRNRVMQVIGRNPTPRDFLEVTRRGRPREAIVGSGKDVADYLEKWFVERACDGF
ncbi:MAG: NtaA/DmoA family FMN-dependent monooxygenase, partial [Acetobacteraceae bacterium]